MSNSMCANPDIKLIGERNWKFFLSTPLDMNFVKDISHVSNRVCGSERCAVLFVVVVIYI